MQRRTISSILSNKKLHLLHITLKETQSKSLSEGMNIYIEQLFLLSQTRPPNKLSVHLMISVHTCIHTRAQSQHEYTQKYTHIHMEIHTLKNDSIENKIINRHHREKKIVFHFLSIYFN